MNKVDEHRIMDLGFTYTQQGAAIRILHHGKAAATLRGDKALSVGKKLADASPEEQQQLMARLTGNYKRGNERAGSSQLRRK
jgi:hypothetical protein